MPRSYLPEAMPGMIVSKVALTMLTRSPITWPSAWARSASMPTTVWPSGPMNSFGAYVASAATVSVPFDLIDAGTWAAMELTAPDGPLGDGAGLAAELVQAAANRPAARTIPVIADNFF